MSAARIVRAALFSLNVATAIRFSKKKAAEAGSIPEVNPASCSAAPGFVFDAVRGVANQLLGQTLKPLDPQDFDLWNVNHEIDLTSWCSIGMDLNTSLHMTGYGGTQVSSLECANARCVDSGGLFGCRKTEFEFAARVSTRELLHLHGRAFGDWSLCGIPITDRETTLGTKFSNTAVKASLAVEVTWGFPPTAEITGVRNVDLEVGDLEGFECGFSLFPDFIGSRLEAICTKMGTWLVGVTREHLAPLLKAVLEKLLGQVLPLEEYQ